MPLDPPPSTSCASVPAHGFHPRDHVYAADAASHVVAKFDARMVQLIINRGRAILLFMHEVMRERMGI